MWSYNNQIKLTVTLVGSFLTFTLTSTTPGISFASASTFCKSRRLRNSIWNSMPSSFIKLAYIVCISATTSLTAATLISSLDLSEIRICSYICYFSSNLTDLFRTVFFFFPVDFLSCLESTIILSMISFILTRGSPVFSWDSYIYQTMLRIFWGHPNYCLNVQKWIQTILSYCH